MSQAVTTTPGVRVVDGRSVPEPGTWELDPAHQSFEFVARHLMAKVRGKFTGVSGTATVTEAPEDSTLAIELDTTTITTGDPTRDGHLRSNDFFGTDDHPTISFSSTAIRPGPSQTTWQVDGQLTIRGISRPVTVELEFLGGAIDPWGNQRIGVSGVVPEVNREDWGLTWNTPLETGGFLLSKSVRLEIEAELVRK
jgi:polyisoprenoid-binding protein YceI